MCYKERKEKARSPRINSCDVHTKEGQMRKTLSMCPLVVYYPPVPCPPSFPAAAKMGKLPPP